MRFEQTTFIAAPPEAVWPLLAQTDRLNREMGLPPILFQFSPREAGGSDVTATIRVAGQSIRYTEHPFEWVRPNWHRVRRTFFGGPFREIRGGPILEAFENGTRVTVWSEIEPSGPAGAAIARIAGPKLVGDCIHVCSRFEAYLLDRAATPYPRHAARPPADRQRLDQARERLRVAGAHEGVVERLAGMIAGAAPEELVTMRPSALADLWNLPRKAVLETCLLAARQGALELRWRILCPECRGGPAATSLGELRDEVHCPSCNIRYGPEMDRSVEVCFRVAPALRRVADQTFCIGGPELMPHIAAQWVLQPGEKRVERIELAHGNYQLASLQCPDRKMLKIGGGGEERPYITLTEGDSRPRLEANRSEVGSCAEWTWANDLDEEVTLRLETAEWARDSVTASHVTSLQAFRDQFGSEVLSPGTEIGVRQICLLFSDLKGSTAMYRERGDAPSYRTVREHFDWMREIIAANDGAVVKTIGDAVMATFSDPADGVRAAVRMQREAPAQPGGLVVKLGLHYGPAIAVNANGLLDYFGQTVNLAARLQRQSQGGDVVIAEETAGDPGVAALLDGLTAQRSTAMLSGIDAPVPIVRVTV